MLFIEHARNESINLKPKPFQRMGHPLFDWLLKSGSIVTNWGSVTIECTTFVACISGSKTPESRSLYQTSVWSYVLLFSICDWPQTKEASPSCASLSGTTWTAWIALTKPNEPIKDPIPWKLHQCDIVHPKNKFFNRTDDGFPVAVYFQGNLELFFSRKSTLIELYIHIQHTRRLSFRVTFTHFGRGFISALLSLLSAFSTLRFADPDEFMRQAFLGGRLDLT